MNNILITSAGQRVSLVRAFQKELKAYFAEAKVFTVDMNPVLAPACHISDGYKSVKQVNSLGYISDLIKICQEWNVKIIVPTIDTELLLLSENKKAFENLGITIIVSDLEFVKLCRDKRLTNSFFEDRKIEIPKAINKDKPEFPLFIKPYDGSLSKDIYLIKEATELLDFHLLNEKFMFMEYIDPIEYDEYTVDAYYDKNNELKCVVPRKRIFVRSGEVNKGVTHKNEIIAFIKSKLSKIEGVIGCLTIQLFFNPITKRILGIEINPRFGGGYPLSYLAGANFPKWIIEEYLSDQKVEFFDNWKEKLLMLRYDDEVLVQDYEG